MSGYFINYVENLTPLTSLSSLTAKPPNSCVHCMTRFAPTAMAAEAKSAPFENVIASVEAEIFATRKCRIKKNSAFGCCFDEMREGIFRQKSWTNWKSKIYPCYDCGTPGNYSNKCWYLSGKGQMGRGIYMRDVEYSFVAVEAGFLPKSQLSPSTSSDTAHNGRKHQIWCIRPCPDVNPLHGPFGKSHKTATANPQALRQDRSQNPYNINIPFQGSSMAKLKSQMTIATNFGWEVY